MVGDLVRQQARQLKMPGAAREFESLAGQGREEKAKDYLDAAILEAKNLPLGDKYSLDFIRTPKDKKTIQEMIDILFAKGSPIYRVKIGTQWYDANGPVTP